MQKSRLLNVETLAAENPGLTQRSLRWLVFNSNKNGLDQSGALIRLGRKVLFDEAKFFAWVEAQSSASLKRAA